jgi:hypothetical protein
MASSIVNLMARGVSIVPDPFDQWLQEYHTFFLLRQYGLDTDYDYLMIKAIWQEGMNYALRTRRGEHDNDTQRQAAP